jgi:hypothetical protein
MATSNHSYIPPSASDSRSPCPALNALANHSILYVFIGIRVRRTSWTDVYLADLTMGVILPPTSL